MTLDETSSSNGLVGGPFKPSGEIMSRTAWRAIGIFIAVVLVGAGAITVWVTITERQSQTSALDARIDGTSSSPTTASTVTTALATTSADDRFFADLDNAQVPYAVQRKDLVIEDGHAICNAFGLGDSWDEVLSARDHDLHAIEKIAAAVDAYCPQYKKLLN